MIQKLWVLMNPLLFQTIFDTLEDSLQASMPALLHSVNVEDFELGTNSPTITDIQTHPTTERDGILLTFKFILHPSYIGGNSLSHKTKSNPYIVLNCRFGRKGIPALRVPVFVGDFGIVGKMKIFVKMMSSPPFLKTAKISFPSLPQIDFALKILRLSPTADLPWLSEFVLQSVEDSVNSMVVEPNVYELDLENLLLGDDALHEPKAFAVVMIHVQEVIHYTETTNPGDFTDPYLTLSLLPSGKLLHRTRAFKTTCHPIFDEYMFVLLSKDDLRNAMKLELWDFDQFTADDEVGSLIVPFEDMDDRKGRVFEGWKELWSRNSSEKGRVNLSLSVYPKSQNSHYEHSSGILIVQLYQANDLDMHPDDMAYGRDQLNPYAEIFINDVKVYKSRVKLYNRNPYWNVAIERFVKDWRNTRLKFVVFDERDFEYNAVLGTVELDLCSINDKGELSGWFELGKGCGSGKIRVHLKFKPVEMELPFNLRGWDVGSLILKSATVTHLDRLIHHKPHCQLHVRVSSLEPMTGNYKSTKISGNPPRWSEAELNTTIPIQFRYQSEITFLLETSHKIFSSSKSMLTGTLPLQNVIDNETVTFQIPLNLPDELMREKSRECADPKCAEYRQMEDNQRKNNEAYFDCKENVAHTAVLPILNVSVHFRPGKAPEETLKQVKELVRTKSQDRLLRISNRDDDSEDEDHPDSGLGASTVSDMYDFDDFGGASGTGGRLKGTKMSRMKHYGTGILRKKCSRFLKKNNKNVVGPEKEV
ncbi:C2 domain-containing protein [Paraphysoderma sedebokerense]|nr:C2 domain-containing protein [Paraphysoderma sedebokerense]